MVVGVGSCSGGKIIIQGGSQNAVGFVSLYIPGSM